MASHCAATRSMFLRWKVQGHGVRKFKVKQESSHASAVIMHTVRLWILDDIYHDYHSNVDPKGHEVKYQGRYISSLIYGDIRKWLHYLVPLCSLVPDSYQYCIASHGGDWEYVCYANWLTMCVLLANLQCFYCSMGRVLFLMSNSYPETRGLVESHCTDSNIGSPSPESTYSTVFLAYSRPGFLFVSTWQ